MNTQIIQRNNAAVQLLQNGRCSDASVALKLALLKLQGSFRNIEATVLGPTDSNPPLEGVIGESTSSSRPPLQGTPIEIQGDLDKEVSDAFLLLYDRAFCLPLDETRERVVSSVILYNCALASHISGVLRGNSTNLTNALKLYKYAYRILQQRRAEEADSTELLLLALYNNMGHASYQLFHLEEAVHYVKCLREQMGLSDSENAGAILPTIEDEDYDFFCFNVAIRVELMGAPAA